MSIGGKRHDQSLKIKEYKDKIAAERLTNAEEVKSVIVSQSIVEIDEVEEYIPRPIDPEVFEVKLFVEEESVEPVLQKSDDILQSKDLVDKIWDSHPNNPKNKKTKIVIQAKKKILKKKTISRKK